MLNFTLYSIGCTGVAGLCIISLFKTLFGRPNPFFYNDKLYFAAASLFLILNKLCFFNAGIINIDEPLLLSAGRTLGAEPWPWISVDTTTSGPLNFLPSLLLLKIFPGASYGELRMLYVLICVIPAMGIFFFTIRKITNAYYARVAIIPLLLTFVFFNQHDLVHASSEHIPLVIFSFIICTVILIANNYTLPSWQLIVAGFLGGASFYSKLQVTPVVYFVLFLCFVLLYFVKKRQRDAWLVVVGFIACNVGTLGLTFSYGGFPDFVRSYVEGNLHYSSRTLYVWEAATEFITPALYNMLPLLLFAISVLILLIVRLVKYLPSRGVLYHGLAVGLAAILFIYCLKRAWHHLPGMITQIGIANVIMYVSVLTVIVLLVALRFIYRRNVADLCMYVGMALAVMITAYCIAKPGRFYLHYVMLFFLPLYAATIWVLIRNVKNITPRISVFVSICVAMLFAQNILNAHQTLNDSWMSKKHTDPHIIAYFNKNKLPGDRLAIWGWGSDYNHEAGLLMGTRDVHFDFQTNSTQPEFARYYQERYLADLRKNKPKWLLDLSSPGGIQTYEKLMLVHFKDINSYVQAHYKEIYRSDFRILYERVK
jgi:hypothetical protein